MSHDRTFKLFGEKELEQLLWNKRNYIKAEIDDQPDNYILNVNETDFINHLYQKYFVNNIEFEFDKISVSPYEKNIPVEQLYPTRQNLVGMQTCRKNIYRFYIPFIYLLYTFYRRSRTFILPA